MKFIFSFLFLCCFASVDAIEIIPAQPDSTVEIEVLDSLPQRFISYIQIGLGFSQRTDESDVISHAPMMLAKLYYHLTESLSTKFGVGYSSSNKFKSANWETIQYRNLKLETGFRWDIFSRVFTFYHENGFEYNYYYEPQTETWEQRIGMNFSMGINFLVYESLLLDISVGQTFNNGDFTKTNNTFPQSTPIGLKEDKFFKEVFNPFAVQVLIFKRL